MGQHPHQVVSVAGPATQRRDAEAAVSRQRGGHPMQRRRRQGSVPKHLRVVVGVDVYKARRDHLARSVDLAGGLDAGQLADRRYAAALDSHVRSSTR